MTRYYLWMVFGKNGVEVEESSEGGQCEVAEEGGLIFTLWFFLGIWKMDTMIMEILRSRSFIYINDHRKIRIARTYTQTRSSVSFCTT